MTSVLLQLPPVTAYQKRSMFDPTHHAVIEATTKAGKTVSGIFWLLQEAWNHVQHGEAWWVAPIYPQTEIAYRRFCSMFRQIDPQGEFWKSNDSKLSIKLRGEVDIRFKSGDNPDHLYGEDVFACVIDEASRCKPEVWHAVRSTLTATNGRVRIIGNVKGKKNWAYQLARRAEAGTLPDWKYARITCYDAVKAGIISQEQIESARRELPEHVFRELYEGVPSDDGANPFGLQHIEACLAPLSNAEPVAFGVDLARKQDWLVVVGLDASGHACRFDRWQHVPWGESLDRIAAIVGDVPALVDSTGLGDVVVDQLQRRIGQVEGFQFSAPSKQKLMEGLAVAIQEHRIRFPDGPIRIELEAFEYEPTRTATRYSAPDGMHDDCVCALALAVQCLQSKRQPVAMWLDGPMEVETVGNRIDRFFDD